MLKCTLFSILVSLILISCGADDPVLFTMDMEVDFEIPAGLNTIEKHFFEVKNVPTRSNLYGSNLQNVSRIHAHDAILGGRITVADFGIVDRVSVWMISRQDPTLRREIFFQEFVDFDHRGELPLFSSISEVQDIIRDDFVDLEIQLIFRSFTPQLLDSRLRMNFKAYGS